MRKGGVRNDPIADLNSDRFSCGSDDYIAISSENSAMCRRFHTNAVDHQTLADANHALETASKAAIYLHRPTLRRPLLQQDQTTNLNHFNHPNK
jgi:hypothetical protein